MTGYLTACTGQVVSTQAYNTDYVRKQRADRLSRGLCTKCGDKPSGNKTACVVCREKAAASQKKRRDTLKASGLCYRCASPVAGNTQQCFRHWIAAAAWNQLGSRTKVSILVELWEEQKGRCAYTGVKLIPGGDASIDHKTPRSRGGASIKKNLQWVTKKVNRVKVDLTHREFINLCKKIASRF